MKRIVVFCGSSSGTDTVFEKYAYALGKTLADQRIGLVYGGAKVGLMGAVANGALENGGEVIGILPRFLGSKEIAHEHLTELIWVDTMHQRKTRMNELAEGVIVLPGGFGSMEEFFEMLTWSQLGLHTKPIGILNVNGFYDGLLAFIQTLVDKGFVKPSHQDMVLTAPDIEDLLHRMKTYEAPPVPKWITQEEV